MTNAAQWPAEPQSEDPQQAIADADPESVARTIVLRRLTAAPQTRQQLEQALSRRAVPPDVAAKVLDRMTEVGLIDDTAYAHEYVRVRRAVRSLSRRALAMELRRKGVSDDDASDALDAVDAEADRAAAVDLVERKWASVSRLDRDAARRRLVGMLARRGFGASMAFSVVREVEERNGLVGTAGDDITMSGFVADGAD